MPDPEYDPEEMSGTWWLRITVTFDAIAKWWKKIFGKEKQDDSP